MKLTAIAPCYYDAQAAPIMHLRLRAVFALLGVDYEIIFVNDASPDNAAEVLAKIASRDNKVMVITHSRNFGTQAVFATGMKYATGDAVILLDGDLQDPPELIEQFYRKWQEGYQVVYGERVRREASWLMNLAYRAFYRLHRAMADYPVPLDAGDFCLMDRRVLKEINCLPEADRCIRGLRAWVGFKQTGIPFIRPARMFGNTTYRPGMLFSFARKAILSSSYAPLEAVTWLALGVVGLSALGATAQVIVKLVVPTSAPSGFTLLLLAVLFLGGVQMLCMGILGAYLARVYEEVKRRPNAIVESVVNNQRSVT